MLLPLFRVFLFIFFVFFSFPTGLDDFMEGTKSFIYLRFDSPDGFECDVFGVFVDFFDLFMICL